MKRALVFQKGKSNKFWRIDQTGKCINVRFGRIGSEGQVRTKKLPDAAAARSAAQELIADKLAKGYEEASAKPTDGKRHALLELAALLAPGDRGVAREVARAVDDPGGYIAAFAERLDERGIDEPEEELARIALLDALIERKLATEEDWRQDNESLQANLDALKTRPRGKNLWRWTRVKAGIDTATFIKRAGKEFRAHGAALAELSIDTDSYPLIVLAPGDVERARKLAKSAGFTRLTVFG